MCKGSLRCSTIPKSPRDLYNINPFQPNALFLYLHFQGL